MLPVWVSPVQARIIPVAKQFVKPAMGLLTKLEEAGIRADLDDRDDTIQSRVRESELSWVPYTIIFGEKEVKSQQLTVRSREEGKEVATELESFLTQVQKEISGYPTRPLSFPVLMSKRPGYKRV